MYTITSILLKSGRIALKLGSFIYLAVRIYDQISQAPVRRGK